MNNNLCPYCSSKYIVSDPKTQKYHCESCGQAFDTPYYSTGIKIFLSYGHEKEEIVNKIRDFLNDNGYDAWLDTYKIKTGADWREKITRALCESEQVISFISPQAMREKGVCIDEMRIAVCLKRAYIQLVRLEDTITPAFISHTQWLDMSDWSEIPEEEREDYFNSKMQVLLKSLQDDKANYNRDMKLLSDTLSTINSTVVEDLLNRRELVGRDWLFDRIHAWIDDPKEKVLTLYGIPGVGKSAIAAYLSLNCHNVFSSIFFKWNNLRLKNVESFTATLALKLASTMPGYRAYLCDLCERFPNLNSYKGQELFDAIILTPLINFINGNHETVVLVFDALDETSDEVIDLITRNISAFPDFIKILFTSRKEPNISSRLYGYSEITIDDAKEQNMADIQKYICKNLELDENSDIAKQITEKTEGSFMYAVSFCDSVISGRFKLSDLWQIPSGLNNWYQQFFRRIFTDVSFESARPFLELLCIDEDIPEELITDCLGLDAFSFYQLRKKLKSLITYAEVSFAPFRNASLTEDVPNNYRVFRFVHQSIKEWLTNPQLADDYYIDASRGYSRMALYCMDHPEKMKDDLEDFDAVQFIMSLADKLDDPNSDLDIYSGLHDQTIATFLNKNYIKWLILGGKYNEATKELLNALPPEKFQRTIDTLHYVNHQILPYWIHADVFPNGQNIDQLVDGLRRSMMLEIVWMGSFLRHKPSPAFLYVNISDFFVLLSKIMDSGRYAPAFFYAVELLPLNHFLNNIYLDVMREPEPDIYKLNMAHSFMIILEKLNKKGIRIPKYVEKICCKVIEACDPFLNNK